MLLDGSKGSPAQAVVGEDAIRSHLSNLNREVSLQTVMHWGRGLVTFEKGNSASLTNAYNLSVDGASPHGQVRTRQHQLHDEVLLDVQLPIASLAGHAGAADDIAFQLLDTPGPNESGEGQQLPSLASFFYCGCTDTVKNLMLSDATVQSQQLCHDSM